MGPSRQVATWTWLQVEPSAGLVVSECHRVAAGMAGVPLVSSCAVGLLCNSHETMARCLHTSGALIRRLIVEAGSKRSLGDAAALHIWPKQGRPNQPTVTLSPASCCADTMGGKAGPQNIHIKSTHCNKTYTHTQKKATQKYPQHMQYTHNMYTNHI